MAVEEQINALTEEVKSLGIAWSDAIKLQVELSIEVAKLKTENEYLKERSDIMEEWIKELDKTVVELCENGEEIKKACEAAISEYKNLMESVKNVTKSRSSNVSLNRHYWAK